jgi:hypothetical protein
MGHFFKECVSNGVQRGWIQGAIEAFLFGVEMPFQRTFTQGYAIKKTFETGL